MYIHAVCGGTFDHFHEGHKQFLRYACLRAKKVTIGITVASYTQKKPHSGVIQSYPVRKRAVNQFLDSLHAQYEILSIHDQYGDTLQNSEYDCIVVTKDTAKTASKINRKRVQLGLKPLTMLTAPFVYAQNKAQISSEQIRKGEMTRQGESYTYFLFSRECFYLPVTLKKPLRIPLGHIVSGNLLAQIRKIEDGNKKKGFLDTVLHIAIGDIVTGFLKKANISCLISVVDGKTQRKALDKNKKKYIFEKDRQNALNPRGSVQINAVRCLFQMVKNWKNKASQQLEIEGEEDLMVLPTVLLAPLGSIVWYGLRNRGAVYVEVTEKKKETVYNLMKQFN